MRMNLCIEIASEAPLQFAQQGRTVPEQVHNVEIMVAHTFGKRQH